MRTKTWALLGHKSLGWVQKSLNLRLIVCVLRIVECSKNLSKRFGLVKTFLGILAQKEIHEFEVEFSSKVQAASCIRSDGKIGQGLTMSHGMLTLHFQQKIFYFWNHSHRLKFLAWFYHSFLRLGDESNTGLCACLYSLLENPKQFHLEIFLFEESSAEELYPFWTLVFTKADNQR